MTHCRFNKHAPCNGSGVCETCNTPNLYGWFPLHVKMKWVWEQRFILPKARRDRIAYYERQITDAEAMIRQINSIPSKEAWGEGK